MALSCKQPLRHIDTSPRVTDTDDTYHNTTRGSCAPITKVTCYCRHFQISFSRFSAPELKTTIVKNVTHFSLKNAPIVAPSRLRDFSNRLILVIDMLLVYIQQLQQQQQREIIVIDIKMLQTLSLTVKVSLAPVTFQSLGSVVLVTALFSGPGKSGTHAPTLVVFLPILYGVRYPVNTSLLWGIRPVLELFGNQLPTLDSQCYTCR